MKRSYQEHILERKIDKETVPAHIVVYDYDTEDIKEECCVCGGEIESSEERYKRRGNYCEKCSAVGYKNRHQDIKNL